MASKNHLPRHELLFLSNRLRALGFSSYREYLRSERWQITKTRMFFELKYRCKRCRTKEGPLQLHHRTYERLGQERPTDLFWLCGDCHKFLHFEQDQFFYVKVQRWKKDGSDPQLFSPPSQVCGHLKTQDRMVTFKDGTNHMRVECLECGKLLRYRKQSLTIQ